RQREPTDHPRRARARHRAPGAAAVTAREPEQRIRRAVAAEKVKSVVRPAPLLPANLHFAIKEVAEIGPRSRLPQIFADVAIKLRESLRIRFLFLDFVIDDRALARFE